MLSKNVGSADNQQATKKKVSDEYFVGFTDGEGCFYVGFSKRLDLPLKWQVITEFHLSQNPGGGNILKEFRKRLDCGYLKPNHAKNPSDRSWILIVKDRKDLEEKVIPFFKKHPLQTSKRKDFEVFTRVIELVKKGKHLDKDGFKKIVKLVFKTDRKTKKKYSEEMLLS